MQGIACSSSFAILLCSIVVLHSYINSGKSSGVYKLSFHKIYTLPHHSFLACIFSTISSWLMTLITGPGWQHGRGWRRTSQCGLNKIWILKFFWIKCSVKTRAYISKDCNPWTLHGCKNRLRGLQKINSTGLQRNEWNFKSQRQIGICSTGQKMTLVFWAYFCKICNVYLVTIILFCIHTLNT